MEGNRRLGLGFGLGFFYFILNSPPDFTWTEKIWEDNVKWTPSTLCSILKCQNQSRQNPYQNYQTKNEKVTKKVHLFSKDFASSEISSIGKLLRHCLMYSETDDWMLQMVL